MEFPDHLALGTLARGWGSSHSSQEGSSVYRRKGRSEDAGQRKAKGHKSLYWSSMQVLGLAHVQKDVGPRAPEMLKP